VTGDLTSAFRPYQEAEQEKLPFLQKVPFIETIFNAKFREAPSNYKILSAEEIAQIGKDPVSSPMMPKQEPGVKPSCALPYQLYADGSLSDDKKNFEIKMEARKDLFGEQSAGSPFNIYFPGKYAAADAGSKAVSFENTGSRSYAVGAGDSLTESFPVRSFENGLYHLRLYGPNGFFREYRGNEKDPELLIQCEYERNPLSSRKLTGRLQIIVKNKDHHAHQLEIRDHAYKSKTVIQRIAAGATAKIVLDQNKSFGWYDCGITAKGFDHFEKRYAGRIETGQEGFSDPYMGRTI